MLAVMVCALHLALGEDDLRRHVLWCPTKGPRATIDSLCKAKVSDLYTESSEVGVEGGGVGSGGHNREKQKGEEQKCV